MPEGTINEFGEPEPPLLPRISLVGIICGDKTVRPDLLDQGAHWVGLKGGSRSDQKAYQGLSVQSDPALSRTGQLVSYETRRRVNFMVR